MKSKIVFILICLNLTYISCSKYLLVKIKDHESDSNNYAANPIKMFRSLKSGNDTIDTQLKKEKEVKEKKKINKIIEKAAKKEVFGKGLEVLENSKTGAIISFKHPKEARLIAVGLIRNTTENGTESETDRKGRRKKRGTCNNILIY